MRCLYCIFSRGNNDIQRTNSQGSFCPSSFWCGDAFTIWEAKWRGKSYGVLKKEIAFLFSAADLVFSAADAAQNVNMELPLRRSRYGSQDLKMANRIIDTLLRFPGSLTLLLVGWAPFPSNILQQSMSSTSLVDAYINLLNRSPPMFATLECHHAAVA